MNKNWGWRSIIAHPLLFALYPVVTLFSENAHEIQLSQTYRSFFAVSIGALGLTALFKVVFKDWHKGAAFSSVLLVTFFSYGHVYTRLKTATFAGELVGRHRHLIPLWIVILVFGAWVIAARMRDSGGVTRVLNLVAAVALAWPLFNTGIYFYQSRNDPPTRAASRNEESRPLQIPNETTRPDVYFIILDAYGRSDILQERYFHDNTQFIEFLKDSGFYVADRSLSNYVWTPLSIASTLNMDYIPNLDVHLERGRYTRALYDRIKQSEVRRQLESLGYSTVALTTGMYATEIYDADYFLTPETSRLDALRLQGGYNAFEGLLFHTSAGLILADIDRMRTTDWLAIRLEYPYKVQREIILGAFDGLESIPEIPGPKFVFAHVISPHRPYLFGPDEEDLANQGAFTFAEIPAEDVWNVGVPRYRDQLIFVNSRVQRMIERILARSKTPPIIILQSDHGPALGLDWENPDQDGLRDRIAILNAYYLPDNCDDHLYPTITPINTFRIIFNCYFGGTYALKEDLTFFNSRTGDRPFEFIPIEEMLE